MLEDVLEGVQALVEHIDFIGFFILFLLMYHTLHRIRITCLLYAICIKK